jgi:glycosyl transferase family 25
MCAPMKHKTYIINLKERTERKKHILNEFAKYPEFEITIFDAIKRKSGSEGLELATFDWTLS